MAGYWLRFGVALAAAAVLIAGCTTPRRAPVSDRAPQAKPVAPEKPAPAVRVPVPPESRPAFHTVKKGETLYSIALEYGLDYKELAEWNGIDPAKLQAGQQLRLAPPGAAVSAAPLKSAPPAIEARPLGTPAPAAPLAGATVVKTEPKGLRVPYSEQSYAQLAQVRPEATIAPKPPEPGGPLKPETTQDAGGLSWMWPAAGKVVGTFNGSTAKGIAIAGKLGQPVLASAAGRVIHSGTGIRGLGRFIVIKHNDAYLSVYAHNNLLLVKEGDSVSRGQKIAEMGNSDSDQVKLHFEIRRFGKPVDPVKLLPDRPA
ncbi:MAG TPA: peptidoglycan DD-metalloendopeptidase family protein [Burkholderiales bacterium]|nr:peptidoglycan DD-metalloendopeptidase family protein [Burkholderiales bacterium]